MVGRKGARGKVADLLYKAPGLHRCVWLDDKGQAQMVEIRDFPSGRKLTYHVEKKTATLQEMAPVPANEDIGSLTLATSELKKGDLEWVGTRSTANGEANVFRRRFPAYGGWPERANEYWIDAKTKQLVAECDCLFALAYDPDHDPVRDNPPEANGSSVMPAVGSRICDIRYNVPLDDSLFRIEAPKGYTVEIKPRKRATEKEMIDYVSIVADANGKVFPDQLTSAVLCDVINHAFGKPRKDRTPAEQRLYETENSYKSRGGPHAPVRLFFYEDPDSGGDPGSIVKGSFRYLGRGSSLATKIALSAGISSRTPKTRGPIAWSTAT